MSFYVPIDHPAEKQKQVLLASKKLLGTLKSYEKYRTTRSEKLDKILQFKTILDKLGVATKKLMAKMPKSSLPKAKAAPKVKANTKGISALEKEMIDIEKRLKSLA
ncbi:MAG: hypothetical protein QF486_04360 [Candidatus Woesearchaeota archaeon]|jgi:hypothetical protein|nr:hypothetical protein [Candidatus Woesearchaeota archaeon]MDP7181734.1 hypothetical protein [Candidatus Woesearchaeota archaeon]MDP7198823.1 hypothetical protein [Candidatus Woesearchaeota archaeon]MDP7467177.1 hypothetical protein [Candidatus Woesearchaeota archaeon]MDP7647488.1 hypothetical protein [Candidatus Woesearchaeota archaeon]|tara:strand:+ start:642 stop:959 length:318 start_codon:yes stop_codon:yes gene_type:complete